MALFWAWWLACVWAAMPVESVDYSVSVVGPLAEVTVRQVFVNDGPDVIEAVYVFPMHEQAALDGMQMRIDGRVITGLIQEKYQAQATYDTAIEQGKTAALITQQRPNIFTQRVGNIGPGQRVEVVLRAVQPVPYLDGAYRLVLPLKVMPRFVAPEDLNTSLNTLDVPTHERAFAGPPESWSGLSLTAGLDVVVDAGLPISDLHSSSHEVLFNRTGSTARVLTQRVPMDRDFALQWQVSVHRPSAALFVQDGHAVLTFEPPSAPPREQIVPRELIWVIDQSCSMSGSSIKLVRSAMLEALEHTDARDSIRILRFNNRVMGDSKSHAVTPWVLATARREIRAMQAQGGTYLLDGVLEALSTAPDPLRERYVIFLTDGGISNDRRVLAAIADQVGDARLFAFGVGYTPNRWLLDEMSRFGGGKTTWIRPGESPQEQVRRFIQTIDQPVLSEIEIDWGDWQVEEVFPRRLPALYAGQPLMVSTRIVRQGSSPVVIRGRLGDGAFEQVVQVQDYDSGRAVSSTWARQKIANLERDQMWGDVPELAKQILETSLSYQVLSQYTAFVAVDEMVAVPPGGPLETVEQPAALAPHTTGTTLSKDVLGRIPTGRSYQSAVSMAAGVTGANRSLGGGASNENTYMLDGANITDPVTGTFSVNFNFDAVAPREILLGGYAPSLTGSDAVPETLANSGSNQLDFDISGRHIAGAAAALQHDELKTSLAGPIIQDKTFLVSELGSDRALVGDRQWLGSSIREKLTLQPTVEHRFTLSGAFSRWQLNSNRLILSHLGGEAQARWQWFLSPDVNVNTRLIVASVDQSGDVYRREQLETELSLVSLKDPLGGKHTVGAGVVGERQDWQNQGPLSRLILGDGIARQVRVARFGGYAQDVWRPTSTLTMQGGGRLDLAFGRAHLGPRVHGIANPFSDRRTQFLGGYARFWGRSDRVNTLAGPTPALVRHDVLFHELRHELWTDIVAHVRGSWDLWDGLPTADGTREQLRELQLNSGLTKLQAHRWSATASWRWTVPQLNQRENLYNDGASQRFAHRGRASAAWDLPIDPWTAQLRVNGGLDAVPLGAASPLGDPDRVRLSAGVAYEHQVDLRKGKLVFDGGLMHRAEVADDWRLTELLQVAQPVAELPGMGGLRWQLGARYTF